MRTLAGLPVGRKVICNRCECATYEQVPFTARKEACITRALAADILALAREMSMSAIAELFAVS